MKYTTLELCSYLEYDSNGNVDSYSKRAGIRFKDLFLIPALKTGGVIIIDLDNVYSGFSTSFLTGMLGELSEDTGFNYSYLQEHLLIKCSCNIYIHRCWAILEKNHLPEMESVAEEDEYGLYTDSGYDLFMFLFITICLTVAVYYASVL